MAQYFGYLAMAVMVSVFAGIFAVSFVRNQKMLATLKPPAQLFPVFQAGFAASRFPNEEEPVCVVAYHGPKALIVGVTNLRVLVVKQEGVMVGLDYDHEGEHLGSTEKARQRRGYFSWSHDKGKGYMPTVVNGPFAGEEWLMPINIPGFPAQLQGLHEFSDRFYFAWFY
jgi:hypothetical protein